MITRCAAVAVLLATALVGGPAAQATTPAYTKRLIGYSVEHRPIVGYHLGDRTAKPVTLVLGQMHGDEHAGVVIVRSILRNAARLRGVNLWVVPTMNPDGNAHNTRHNADGVDLNRNWPYNWRHLTGTFDSGPRPLSEPETRAMRRFILRIKPRYVVSIHQPLHGVDRNAGAGPAYRRFRGALARNLNLPVKAFNCWSVCYGSLSSWYHHNRLGVAVETVEFGSGPNLGWLRNGARRGIVHALGGHFHW
jgi:murein peptide amidase A